MKLALLALGLLTLVSAAKADLLESNVTIHLKLHSQQEGVTKNGVTTSSYTTRTLKTVDLIQLIADAETQEFSKKARLILRSNAVNESPERMLIIRDGSTDYELKEPLRIGFAEHLLGGHHEAFVGKGKTTSTKHQEKIFGPGEAQIAPNGGQAGIILSGMLQRTRYTLPSKEFPSVQIYLSSENFTGLGSHVLGSTP